MNNDRSGIESNLPVNGRLHEHCASGPGHLDCLPQTVCGSRGFDNPVVRCNRQVGACDFSGNACLGSNSKLGSMMAKLLHAMTGSVQDLSHEQTQLSVTEHRDLRVSRQGSLFQNLACRSERLHEHRGLIGNRDRNNVQVGFR